MFLSGQVLNGIYVRFNLCIIQFSFGCFFFSFVNLYRCWICVGLRVVFQIKSGGPDLFFLENIFLINVCTFVKLELNNL